jgi:hypothetical protein
MNPRTDQGKIELVSSCASHIDMRTLKPLFVHEPIDWLAVGYENQMEGGKC